MKILSSGRHLGAGYVWIVLLMLLSPASFDAGAEAIELGIQQSTGGDTEDGSAFDPEIAILPATAPGGVRRDRPAEAVPVLRPRPFSLPSVFTASCGIPATTGNDILISIRQSRE